jgi:hypothetical protein
MKSFVIVAAAILTWLFSSLDSGVAAAAQLETDSPAPAGASQVSYILAEFTQSLNAKKLKPGDAIKAQVSQDVLAHGKIVIPADSTLVGHVTEVKASQKEDRPSRLGIVFDKVLLKHHVEVALRGVIHALAAPVMRRSRVDDPNPLLPDSSSGRGTGPIVGTAMPSPHGGSRSSARPDLGLPNPFPDIPNTSGRVGRAPEFGLPQLPGSSPSLSVGTRIGVFGIKGLSLIPGSAGDGEGPVICSEKDDVKIDYRVQVLVKVIDVAVVNSK